MINRYGVSQMGHVNLLVISRRLSLGVFAMVVGMTTTVFAAPGTTLHDCRLADCLAELETFQIWPTPKRIRYGYGLTGRDAVAAHWFEKAVAAGEPRAMHNLALMLWRGEGIERDGNRAIALLEQAAGRGLSPSSLALAHYARLDDRLAEAARHYRAAAERNNARGMHALGNLYMAGRGVPQSLREAYFWYHLASRRRYEPSLTAEARLRTELSTARRREAEARVIAWENDRRSARK